jgi:hypothetical protein
LITAVNNSRETLFTSANAKILTPCLGFSLIAGVVGHRDVTFAAKTAREVCTKKIQEILVEILVVKFCSGLVLLIQNLPQF